jgi:CheY-like chemotaxis protein
MAGAHRPKVLVIDDNPTNLKLISLALRADGFDVSTAHDGASGLAAVDADHPALVYTDVQLPDIDGLQVAGAIKSDPTRADVIVVALTACAMPDDRRRALDAGCDGFIAKPIDTRTIGVVTAGYLDRRGTTEQP